VLMGAHDPRYKAVVAELRQARRALRMSQAELATLLGARQQFVSKYESCERRLDVVETFQIARVLGVDLHSILNTASPG
jgi:transcriptional regulator with XRE-family HTH domain